MGCGPMHILIGNVMTDATIHMLVGVVVAIGLLVVLTNWTGLSGTSRLVAYVNSVRKLQIVALYIFISILLVAVVIDVVAKVIHGSR